MTFDFQRDQTTIGPSSPLYDFGNNGRSVSDAMTYWNVNKGIPKEKLMVGFGTFGRGWTISNSTPPVIRPLVLGPSLTHWWHANENGIVAHGNIDYLIRYRGFSSGYDELHHSPYAFTETTW